MLCAPAWADIYQPPPNQRLRILSQRHNTQTKAPATPTSCRPIFTSFLSLPSAIYALRDFQILSRDYNVKLSNEFYIAKVSFPIATTNPSLQTYRSPSQVIMASNNAAAAAADAALKAAVNAACDATCEAATASAAAAQAIHDLGPTAVAGTVADYAAGAASFAAEAASQAAHALFNARSTNSAISLGHLDQARDLAGHAQEAADHAIDAALDAAANASAAKAAAAGRS
ncbi:hypothetical protein GGTG_08013 [Gaeumannomyces tritici R3-111a-1]|uniref:Uncharacterized protein n=1 Tax=Gaeumannomyces tritici (strain R3-111a-1) TaxID=644352 RepID=J3P3C5_GAET3|nr:hypothetical protein GGTG_08013 [Gaeumannomyces tritici R3-111a-1]EJT74168.1 hypothetical protein GGTG_08013 [Gaeumannomyces tritici R3-111a-1]